MDLLTLDRVEAPTRPSPPHAVVIGAGFGGLAAAIRLGARGYRVTMLEKLDAAGGRASVFRQDGFTFDAGPTILTAPFLLEELWQLCGRSMADDVTLKPVSPFYRIRFQDGSSFEYTGDPDAMRREVARFSPADVEGYETFMRLSETTCRIGFEQLGDVPFASIADMVRITPDLLRLGGHRSVHGLVSKFIKDERLRVVFSFHPLLIGGNPFTASAIYTLIPYLERRWGVHFAIGGTGQVVSGLVNLIEGQGSTIRYNAEVDRILVSNGRARGVQLTDGETVAADIVVSNADSAWTYRKLLPPSTRRRWTDRKLKRASYSMGLFLWCFGTDRRYEEIAHHTIVLGPRYRELLDDIFKRKVLADDFSLYLHRPTATDASLAPPGCDAFYVLSPVPNMGGETDWPTAAEPYRMAIASHLSATMLPDLERHVVSSKVMTPLDFQTRLCAWHGAAFGLEPVLLQSAWFRPHNRSEDVDGLYSWAPERIQAPGSRVCSRPPKCLIVWCRMPLLYNTDAADLEACRALLRGGSKSFDAASKLLPRSVREPVIALYAFCREADDVIDSGGGSLHWLQERLNRAYEGRPLSIAADRAFTHVVQQFAIPRELPEALLEGFAWDVEGRRYADLPALRQYAVRVAGTVGAMMAVLMGVRDPRRLASAIDLGVAMQLSNIARDVGEDARNGRIYLPLDWLADAGIDPGQFLAAPAHSPALALVVDRLLKAADQHYRRASAGICRLPIGCRLGIGAARLLYAEIGWEVSRRDMDSVSARAVVSGRRKARVLATGLAGLMLPLRPLDGECMPEANTLVEAVVQSTPRVVFSGKSVPWWALFQRMRWTIDLFERLEQRERVEP